MSDRENEFEQKVVGGWRADTDVEWDEGDINTRTKYVVG